MVAGDAHLRRSARALFTALQGRAWQGGPAEQLNDWPPALRGAVLPSTLVCTSKLLIQQPGRRRLTQIVLAPRLTKLNVRARAGSTVALLLAGGRLSAPAAACTWALYVGELATPSQVTGGTCGLTGVRTPVR